MTNDPSYPNVPPPAAQQLGYSAGVRGKPGILTAVGIVSIFVALIGAASSLTTVGEAVLFGIILPRTTTTFSAGPATAPPPVAPAPPTTAPPPATAPSLPSSSGIAPATFSPTASAADFIPNVAMGGKVIVWGNSPPTTAPSPGGATTAPATTAPVTFTMKIDRVTMVTMFADGISGLALSIFLFVLGIMTLTGSPRARWGHLLWAWLSFPAIVLSFFSTVGFGTAMLQNAATMGGTGGISSPPSFFNTFAVIKASIYAVLALIYPRAILSVMRTKRVKEYYEAGAGSGMV